MFTVHNGYFMHICAMVKHIRCMYVCMYSTYNAYIRYMHIYIYIYTGLHYQPLY